MSAPLFTSPLYQPLNDSGQIQPQCKLQFFKSSTTTPTDVYANAGLLTTRGSEVTADAAGRFPVIYLDPKVALRVKLLTSAGVLIYDLDPVFPSPGQFIGQVVMYDGDLEDLPAGWHVCDGTNGTRDARDRVIIGAGSTYPLGDTGGAATASGSTGAAGAHDHGGATDGHALSAEENGPHKHGLLCANNSGDSNADGWLNTDNMSVPGEDVGPHQYRDDNLGGTDLIESSGDGEPHSHPITAVGNHSHSISSFSILPPYLGLYFVKFTGA